MAASDKNRAETKLFSDRVRPDASKLGNFIAERMQAKQTNAGYVASEFNYTVEALANMKEDRLVEIVTDTKCRQTTESEFNAIMAEFGDRVFVNESFGPDDLRGQRLGRRRNPHTGQKDLDIFTESLSLIVKNFYEGEFDKVIKNMHNFKVKPMSVERLEDIIAGKVVPSESEFKILQFSLALEDEERQKFQEIYDELPKELKDNIKPHIRTNSPSKGR